MSRRPALTDAAVKAIETALPLLVGAYGRLDQDWPDGTHREVARAIQYLENLTAWHKQQREGKR